MICIGRNYADHILELKNAAPRQPFFFLKPPSSILLAGEGPLVIPRGVIANYEVELGLVIGQRLKDAELGDEEALEYIRNYILAIDMTARNVQDEAKKKGLPWTIAKGFDTFLPVAGPISKAILTDPHNVELWLKVNGVTKQKDSTGLMLFRIGKQLSEISKVMTLDPGDVVLTGTPKGVGPVQGGDQITAGIDIDGKSVKRSMINLRVEDSTGPYEFKET